MHKQLTALCAFSLLSFGAAAQTTYDLESNQLLLDEVRIGGEIYTNLLIDMGNSFQVIGSVDSMPLATTGKKSYCSVDDLKTGVAKLKKGMSYILTMGLFPCVLRQKTLPYDSDSKVDYWFTTDMSQPDVKSVTITFSPAYPLAPAKMKAANYYSYGL